VYYAFYNVLLTVFAMGMIMLVDQDLNYRHSTKTQEGKPGDYESETRELGFTVQSYYLFNKRTCVDSLIYRLLIWSVWSMFCGVICYEVAS
jgi:hypothetical protein